MRIFAAGPVVTRRALEAGLSEEALADLVATGALKRPFKGVYLRADLSDDLAIRAAALSLVLPPGAAAGRGTAAWLYGIDTRLPGRHHDIPPTECVVPVGVDPIRRPGVKSYVAPLDDEDVTLHGGIRITTPERTALDLARWLPPHMGLAVIDAMTHQGVVALGDLVTLSQEPRWNGVRHIARARRLVDHCEPKAESYGESWTRLRIVDAGFPRPQVQIPVRNEAGREIYRLDLGYAERRYALEYDGEEFHTSSADRAHDLRRRDDLRRRHLWRVTPVTKGDVLGRSLALERALGEEFGAEPQILFRAW